MGPAVQAGHSWASGDRSRILVVRWPHRQSDDLPPEALSDGMVLADRVCPPLYMMSYAYQIGRGYKTGALSNSRSSGRLKGGGECKMNLTG